MPRTPDQILDDHIMAQLAPELMQHVGFTAAAVEVELALKRATIIDENLARPDDPELIALERPDHGSIPRGHIGLMGDFDSKGSSS